MRNRKTILITTAILTFLTGIIAYSIWTILPQSQSNPFKEEPKKQSTAKNTPVNPDEKLFGYTSNHFAVNADQFFGINLTNKKIVKSNNGGETWQKIDFTGNQELKYLLVNSPVQLFFVSNMHGWITGNEKTWETFDGGDSWKRIFGNNAIHQMFFSDNKNGWMNLTSNGRYKSYLTEDGGINWKACPGNSKAGAELWSAFFISKMRGWAFLEKNKKLFLAHTENAGCNWIIVRKSSLDKTLEINDLFFTNETTGWLSTLYSVYHTADGGKSWKQLNIPDETAQIESFFFKNKNEGWILFASLPEEPIFYQTFDGGITWHKGNKKEFFQSYKKDVKFPQVPEGLRRAIVIQSITGKM